MITVIYPITPVLGSALTYSRHADVPIRYECPVLDPAFMSNETDGWNCNLCQGVSPFYQPYVKGDILPFQTRFTDNFNASPETITAGIRSLVSPVNYYVQIELIDADGNVFSNIADDFCSDYWVGYSESTGSVQTWFVNTGLLPDELKCFRLRITYYEVGGIIVVPPIWTDEFKEVHECDITTKIQSTYGNFDCNRNYYQSLDNTLGNSTIAFYNSLRVFGEVEQNGIADSVETNDRDVVISRKNFDNFKIISGLVPPYYFRRIAQAVRGRSVTVDGIEYINFELTDKPDDYRAFPLDITFQKLCFIDNKKCNF